MPWGMWYFNILFQNSETHYRYEYKSFLVFRLWKVSVVFTAKKREIYAARLGIWEKAHTMALHTPYL
jgi:hypothetical protein